MGIWARRARRLMASGVTEEVGGRCSDC